MASRYGRNQKRKAREEIERLTKENAKAEDRLIDLARDNGILRYRIRDWADEILSLLGKGSPFLENLSVLGVDFEQLRYAKGYGKYRVAEIERLSFTREVGPIQDISHSIMDLFVYYVDEHVDEMRNQRVFELRSVQGGSAFVCDERTIQEYLGGEGPQRLAEYIQRQLVSHIKAGRGSLAA